MKIAILGSAPASLPLAPIGQPDWQIWGCSPAVYPHAGTPNAWFELHRWEPGTIGKPSTQKPWFSPEYVAWMGALGCRVWMQRPVPEIPNSAALPVAELTRKYGTYFFTSTIAWMMACAIEDIIERRANNAPQDAEGDWIGLWGVDMAATEEYGYQRAGCQHFVTLAEGLGIHVYVPPESDLLRPMPLYGIDEGSHWHIKLTARRREIAQRLATAEATLANARDQVMFLKGALDDMDYQMMTWGGDRIGAGPTPEIIALQPRVREAVLAASDTSDKRGPEGAPSAPG